MNSRTSESWVETITTNCFSIKSPFYNLYIYLTEKYVFNGYLIRLFPTSNKIRKHRWLLFTVDILCLHSPWYHLWSFFHHKFQIYPVRVHMDIGLPLCQMISVVPSLSGSNVPSFSAVPQFSMHEIQMGVSSPCLSSNTYWFKNMWPRPGHSESLTF